MRQNMANRANNMTSNAPSMAPNMTSTAPNMTQPRAPSPPSNFKPQQASAMGTGNLMNAHHPVNFTPGGPPSMIIPNNDPRPVIRADDNVKDILNRLHSREVDTIDTQDETTANNDRLLSDTTASESKKRGRKKKNFMTIQ